MTASCFVGRVGGLAVALGVGAAVSLGGAAAAWADDSGSADPTGATSAAETSEPADTSQPEGTEDAATTDTITESAEETSTGDGADATPEDGTTDTTEPVASTGDLVRRVSRGMVLATGGARSSKADKRDATLDDVVAELTPAPRTSAGRSNRPERGLEVGDTTPTTSIAPPSQQETSPPPPATVTEDADTAEVSTGPAVVEARLLPSASTKLVSQSISHTSTEPPEPQAEVSKVVLAALATTGLTPPAPDGPVAPASSPLGMALLALGSRPRPYGSSLNSQSTGTLATLAATAAPKFVTKPSIPVGVNPSAAVIGPDGRMYVANTGSGTVSVIDTTTGQRIDASPTSSSTDIRVGALPSALALSHDGKRLYVANGGSATVSVVDTATYARIDANPSPLSMDIRVGIAPSALTFGSDGRLYVANRGSNSVSVIDTTTNTVIDVNPTAPGVQAIPVGLGPNALASGPNGRLYVANRASNTISVVNTTNYSLTNTVAVGKQPASVALDADGKLYVANTGSATVSVIDTATNASGVKHISVGPAPSSVALSPDGHLAYAANGNDTVSVIDTATDTVVGTVTIDTDRFGGHVIAVGADGTVYVTDAIDRTVRILARQGNTAPQAGTPTVGTPDTTTGAVSGALNFTDPDGDPLSYSVTQPTSGTVTITPTGTYTYTPTQAAREQATQTPGRDSATFVVNASDGEATATVTVTVPVAPLGAEPGGPPIDVSLPGTRSGTFANTDGTHAVITSYAIEEDGSETTWAAVVNLVTGDQIGTTITLPGSQADTVVTNDGTRALIVTYDADATRGVMIDLATGTQTGPTITLTGRFTSVELSPDGSHVLLSGYTRDENITRIAVINLATGTQKGTTRAFTGEAFPEVRPVTPDASQVLVSLNIYDGRTSTNTLRVIVIDTATGAQIGNGLVLTGFQSLGPALVTPDDSLEVFSTSHTTSTTGTTTSVAMINTATGNQVGTTLTFSGYGYMQMSDDGSRVIVATTASDGKTQVAVVDTAAGSAVRTTLSGGVWREPVFSADGTRVLVKTVVYRLFGDSYTTRLTVLDTRTGRPINLALTVAGQPISEVSTPDGNRAVILTWTLGNNFISTYRVVAINTITGRQVGTTLTFTGGPQPSIELSADGSEALITTYSDGVPKVTVLRIV
ncbi:beta-propeller fold lactonase family protein [Mycolicibacterium elephantis]|uniref:beta-propeller fold lactonase family protein n=1 Tax=Mycolicibacterium elephantis TaxID=81858 RepID=UPI000AEF307C|nr:beta-propeller fold lactonase family protein [Mycolicibacterium elephantis]